MKITVIGTGYVGLVSGTCFAEMGHDVTCVDKIKAKIDTLLEGGIPIFEPGLEELVRKNTQSGNLNFSLELAKHARQSDAIFIAVGTPPHPVTGHADMKYVHAVAAELAECISGYTVIVNKSTVPVGTGRKVAEIINKAAPEKDFAVASNPEFLREGSAIDDFMRPDRVVVGTSCDRSRTIMADVYKPLTDAGFPLMFTSLESAELIKYASNAFLATKISFINEIADLCEKVGGEINEVSKGMGLDTRIGSKFLQAGPGYGGSCFPKDTLALMKSGQDHACPMNVVQATVQVNEVRKSAMADRIIAACGGDVKDKKISILGLTFKANTDDMRDSPSLTIIPLLVAAGAIIQAYDPEGMEEAKKCFGETIQYCGSLGESLRDSDVAVIMTEWSEFKSLEDGKDLSGLASKNIVDLRNILSPDIIRSNGYSYTSIGRK